ncbi:MAG: two pore domain potassium channel family protein [Deltaproteobacteria bacterium]|nr:two pore domain potassium channel family protein [Deltaproteobacteria bacterium]
MLKEIRIPFTHVRIGRFLFLLISMLLMFGLRPFLEGHFRITILMDIFFLAILLSAVYAVAQKWSTLVIALFLLLGTQAMWWLGPLMNVPSPEALGNILGCLLLAYTATLMLVYLFKEDRITLDMIVGAICVYFLMGLIWSLVFSTLEIFQPGSFQIPRGSTDRTAFTYYSYVTLTTLGYGDITPLSPPARSLALLEAIMGQLYLAVLIARMVGIHIAQSSRS